MRFLRFVSSNLPRFSGLCIFVTVYLSLFVVAGVILFGSLFRIRRNNFIVTPKSRANHPGGLLTTNTGNNQRGIHSFPLLQILDQQQSKVHINNRFAINEQHTNSFSRSVIDLFWSYKYPTLVNCTSLQEVTDLEFVAVGWTKVVYKGNFRGQTVAIKTVNSKGHDVNECQKILGFTLSKCYERAETKLLREIVLLTELAHENVIKVLGFCIPKALGSITLVTEIGEPLDTIRLLQISWEDRLHLVLGMVNILQQLAYSPLGSLSMNDFRRQQFVIVNGALKLTDVDDLGIGEPECVIDEDCQTLAAHIAVGTNATRNHPLCLNFHCIGHNSMLNVWHAGQHFVKLLLPISAPEPLQSHIQELLAAFEFNEKSGSVWDLSYIVYATHDLVKLYKTGEYLNADAGIARLGFKKLVDSDLPGMYDYSCRHSVSAVSCVMSVYNEEEAAQFCAQDTDCKAVVLSQQRTWTGRIVAIFKNNVSYPALRKGFTLLVKQDHVT